MARPPHKDTSIPTPSEPAHVHRQQRVQRSLALVQRLSSGQTSEGFYMSATCAKCGARVRGWREHVISKSARALHPKEDGEFSIRLEYEGACSACGGGVVDIRAEGKR